MRKFVVIFAIVAALAAPATALASDGYTNIAGVNQESSGSSGSGTAPTTAAVASTTTSTDGGGTLPFTGLDLGVMLAVGVVLLGTGVVLRRLHTRSTIR